MNPAELVVEKPVVRKNLEMEVWSQEEVLVAREAGCRQRPSIDWLCKPGCVEERSAA